MSTMYLCKLGRRHEGVKLGVKENLPPKLLYLFEAWWLRPCLSCIVPIPLLQTPAFLVPLPLNTQRVEPENRANKTDQELESCFSPTVRPWASVLTSLNFSFLVWTILTPLNAVVSVNKGKA